MTRARVYTRAEATARKLLARYGSPCTLVQQDNVDSDKPWRPAAAAPVQFTGTAVAFQPQMDSFAEIADITLLRKAAIFVLDQPVEPRINDQFLWAGASYLVAATRTLNPDGNGAILYSVALR